MERPLGKFEFIIRVQYVENWENRMYCIKRSR